ncbi:D-aminoacylase [Pseudomonadales bacterium]|nr:D-aminoacylase [Pseudomonadales bacterium]MDC1478962.1 D-aminoacylase [Pseudomonadales bacterium]|tara:strand:- start:1486 stop:2979 length:1494 start_codon:yes stop_codon:yes gene_type:complete
MSQLTIRNVNILDGTGTEAFYGDVTIEDGRITGVGDATGSVTNNTTEIDGDGLHLAPGFIDTHSHDDGAFFRHPGMEFKLAQGVTSVVTGNCGFSAVPASAHMDSAKASGGILAGIQAGFTDLEGYFEAVLQNKPAINNMMLTGHNTVRSIVVGHEQRAPTREELRKMRALVEQQLEQGSCGFSTGLIYTPGKWSETEEIIELARAANQHNALYTTHMRNEGDRLLEAVEETLTIGQESDVHVHISHHKSAGQPNWGKVRASLERVDEALKLGQRVTLDVYPYTAGSGRMIEYFNLEKINRTFAEVIQLASCAAFRHYEGRMLVDIAKEEAIDITDLVKKILTAPGGEKTICVHFIIDEKDIETNLAHADMMVGSDGIPDLRGRPHPRLFGTFPRVLGKYVRERGILSLPEAVRRMTSLSAETFGLQDRGKIQAGYWADLVLFDPATIIDTATYDNPKQEPTGISLVVVNGNIALQNGQHSGAGAGKMLRYRREAFG